jgi:triosephosphate isomerase
MGKKRTWLVANWKMHGTHAKVRDYAFAVNQALSLHHEGLQVVFCPPATYLETAHQSLPLNARLAIGGQNSAEPPEGAFTGGISAPMLKDVGAAYVILGHSERRQIMHETDKQVAGKVAIALSVGLVPIVCIGETETEYTAGKTKEVLNCQLENLKGKLGKSALIAYEPVWAIGTGKTPTLGEIEAAHSHIKSILGSAQPVLYGGSVKPANIREILSISSVDGALIGGASLEIESMVSMMDALK